MGLIIIEQEYFDKSNIERDFREEINFYFDDAVPRCNK